MKLLHVIIPLIVLGIALSYVNPNLQYKADKEMFLKSYDSHVNSTDSACFTYRSYNWPLTLEVNDHNASIENNGSYCVPAGSLSDGDNFVRLMAEPQISTFFHVQKSDGPKETIVFDQNAPPQDNAKNPLLMFIAAFLVFFLPGMSIAQKFFKTREAAELISLSIAFSITLTFILAWLFSYLDIFNPIALALLLAACSLPFLKGLKLPSLKGNELKIILLFVFISIATQFFLYSHDSPWSVYYERQVDAAYSQKALPQYDPLSYLGRSFTFVPGYIMVKAAFSWMSATQPSETFFLFQILGNLFLFASVFYLGRTLKLDDRKITVLCMFMTAATFIFGWMIISLLHLYSFALLITAVAMALRNKSSSAVAAGMAGIFHASTLFAFPLLVFALQKGLGIKRIIKFSIMAAAFFLIFYSPTLLSYGWPSEIQPKDWGYLITGDIISLGTLTAGLMSLAILPALYLGFKKNRKLTLITLLMIAAFLFLTYRVNFIITVLASVLFVKTFSITSKSAVYLLSALFILSLAINIAGYSEGCLNQPQTAPFKWINAVSGNDSKVLVEPFFGHVSNYYSQRPSLADLYVEYASAEKYSDAMRFISTGDVSLLQKWNISYTVTLHAYTILRIAELKYFAQEIEFKSLDKPYTNIYFNVHYRRQ
jgi:hypothetical protein